MVLSLYQEPGHSTGSAHRKHWPGTRPDPVKIADPVTRWPGDPWRGSISGILMCSCYWPPTFHACNANVCGWCLELPRNANTYQLMQFSTTSQQIPYRFTHKLGATPPVIFVHPNIPSFDTIPKCQCSATEFCINLGNSAWNVVI